MKLYFSRNLNPRLAVAAARYLNSPVEFEFASPFSPGQQEKFRKLNPNLSVPILVEGEKTLWEADAIACRLSQLAKSDFWPMGDSLPDVVRWISWGYWNFVRACDQVHFERVTKQRYGIGPVSQDAVESGLSEFASSAAILEQHLGARIGSSATGSPMPISVSPASCLSRTSPACRFMIFRASKPGMRGSWRSRPGAIRSRGSTRPNCRQSPSVPRATSAGAHRLARPSASLRCRAARRCAR